MRMFRPPLSSWLVIVALAAAGPPRAAETPERSVGPWVHRAGGCVHVSQFPRLGALRGCSARPAHLRGGGSGGPTPPPFVPRHAWLCDTERDMTAEAIDDAWEEREREREADAGSAGLPVAMSEDLARERAGIALEMEEERRKRDAVLHQQLAQHIQRLKEAHAQIVSGTHPSHREIAIAPTGSPTRIRHRSRPPTESSGPGVAFGLLSERDAGVVVDESEVGTAVGRTPEAEPEKRAQASKASVDWKLEGTEERVLQHRQDVARRVLSSLPETAGEFGAPDRAASNVKLQELQEQARRARQHVASTPEPAQVGSQGEEHSACEGEHAEPGDILEVENINTESGRLDLKLDDQDSSTDAQGPAQPVGPPRHDREGRPSVDVEGVERKAGDREGGKEDDESEGGGGAAGIDAAEEVDAPEAAGIDLLWGVDVSEYLHEESKRARQDAPHQPPYAGQASAGRPAGAEAGGAGEEDEATAQGHTGARTARAAAALADGLRAPLRPSAPPPPPPLSLASKTASLRRKVAAEEGGVRRLLGRAEAASLPRRWASGRVPPCHLRACAQHAPPCAASSEALSPKDCVGRDVRMLRLE